MNESTTILPTAAAERSIAPVPVAASEAPSPVPFNLHRRLAHSQSPVIKFLKRARRAVITFSLPTPRVLVVPMKWAFISLRSVYHFLLRVLICEPIFKAYCTKYGRGVRTDCFIHYILGKGDIVLGDNVWMDGKIVIMFAARFVDHPLLQIGDNTGIGHDCRFAIGNRISIGKNCMLSGGTILMDSNGHPTDPRARLENAAPSTDEVRPITIGDGVWIGMNCIIFPGVRIGEGSVISAGSIVRTHVPPYSVVAGNPARVMFRLKRPD